MPASYSLKRRLFGYVSIFSIVLGAVLGFCAYRVSLDEITEILDAQMTYLAENTAHNLRLMQSEFDPKKHYSEEDLFIDVWRYKQPNQLLQPNDFLLTTKQKTGFYRHNTESDTWVLYILAGKDYQIQISQQAKVRQHLALELAASMFLPYLLIIPLALFGLIYIIRRSVKPLDDFKTELAQRDSNSLEPLSQQGYPDELVPSINEMNYLFSRILQAQQEQRQFIADAAHELRTPITALNLQTKILLNQSPTDASLLRMNKGLVRIQHLVSQLLSLAKQDASLNQALQIASFTLNDVMINCVEQLMNLAIEKEIDLGLERNSPLVIQTIEHSVHSIVFNLLDNAIKYTPVAGQINISVFSDDAAICCIQIDDSGPGIAAENYAKVLQRFYRIHHHLEVGSGLGLSIVDQAVRHLNGQLILSQSDLGGLSVLVKLPAKLANR